jgi:prepilin-type N-terminal cleavage/methylation domain-containing protein/prepilin-type processing-associated H-X9-DG protein
MLNYTKTRRSRVLGFTLIEMLVVITIIGILAILVVPTLGKARRSALRTGCASNLRQIGAAVKMYTLDHNSCFPPVTQNDWGTKGFGWISETFYLSYVNNSYEVFRCPAQKVNLGTTTPGALPDFKFPSAPTQWTSYEYNNGMSCSNTTYPKSTLARDISDPTSCAYVFDFKYNLVNNVNYNPHLGGLNVLYADSHVAWLDEKDYGLQTSGQEFYNKGFGKN